MLLAAMAPATALAADPVGSPKLVLRGQTNVEIPLDINSSITVNANGDLEARCRNNTCPQSGSGGAGNVVATLTPSATTLTAGDAFNLQWTSQNADLCRASGPASVGTWAGQVLATSGTKSLTLSAGDYLFSLRCYGLGGGTEVQTTQVKVNPGNNNPPPGGADYCAEYYDGSSPARTRPTHESFEAYGLSPVVIAWEDIFLVAPGATQSDKQVVPGNFMSPSRGRYLAIPFVLTSDTDDNLANIGINWIEGGNYGSRLVPQVASGPVVLTVSPCPGDFRKFNNASADRYENSMCRRTSPSTQGGNFSITSQPSRTGACYAPKGKRMYLNIATYDMSRGTAPTRSTCGDTRDTCGVAIQID